MIFLRIIPLLFLLFTGCSSARVPETASSKGASVKFDEDSAVAYCNPNELLPFKRQPKRKECLPKTIVIDPGHGGKDNGTHSSKTPPYREKDLNLATARVLQRYLQKLGYRVLMTRTEDQAIDLQERASYANQTRCDLFVSIHYNSAPNKDASGIEVYFYHSKDNIKRADLSEEFAQFTLNGITEKTEAKARGVRKGNFAVIRETTMPAILVEGGFLTNPAERDNILNPEYRKKVALGIAQGVEHYFAAQKLASLD